MKTFFARVAIFLFISIAYVDSYAIIAVPASVQPGVIGNIISESLPQPGAPQRPSSNTVLEEVKAAKVPYNPQAAKIKFRLNKIVLEGNTVFTNEELEDLYDEELGNSMSVLEFQQLVQGITNYYRNKGYILSRAIIPPQHVKKGVVKVKVIEGFIDDVKVQGEASRATGILLKYGDEVEKERPINISTLQYYLRLANEIPGVAVKGVIEPSKKTKEAATLVLVTTEKRLDGYVTYDNYGTRYLGPHESSYNVTTNSAFRSGDALSFTYLNTYPPKELRYGDIFYETILNGKGLKLIFDANKSLTKAGFVLTEADVIGNSVIYTLGLQYPAIRSNDSSLTYDLSLIYYNGVVTSLGFLLYDDNVRAARVGGSYYFVDKYKGSNGVIAGIEQGLPIFGATSNPQSFFTSRFGATGQFTKAVLVLNRDQQLFNKFSAYFQALGQYAFNPLLSYEQFTFGGSILGRGYDPAEIIGDHGLAGSAELRMNVYPGLRLFQSAQFYGYYDIGVVWNIKEVIFTPTKLSAASAGGGVRLSFNQHISGNMMITQPLTKQVTAQQIIGEGRWPRFFFGFAASL